MNIHAAIVDNITANLPAYTAAAGVLCVAAVSTIPAKIPNSLQEWWTWMRESLQTAIPAARHPVLPQETNDSETGDTKEK